MNLEELNTGDEFTYAGNTYKIVDWMCLKDPVYTTTADNPCKRIYAVPYAIGPSGHKQLIPTSMWSDCE